jgi:hypothetical protein
MNDLLKETEWRYHPDCIIPPEQCRIRVKFSGSTMLGGSDIYDGNGHLVERDPNTLTWSHHCHTCGRKWKKLTRGEEVWIVDEK